VSLKQDSISTDTNTGSFKKIKDPVSIVMNDKIPRFGEHDYEKQNVQSRLEWLEEKTSTSLKHIGHHSVETESWKGNVENLIGVAQIPIGITGPIKVEGIHAKGSFYVPMATTEGAILTVYNTGMKLVSESGGAKTYVEDNGLHVTSVFHTKSIKGALYLKQWVESNFENIKEVSESTTSHGKLLKIISNIFDGRLFLMFHYFTGDAQGMNMINVATEAACKYIFACTSFDFYVRTNYSGVKKFSPHNQIANFGKSVTAECTISKKTLRKLRVTPHDMVEVSKIGYLGQTKAGISGVNCQIANSITAIYLACGQDMADISTSHNGYVNFELTESEDLYISVYLPSLLVGTVGGGTNKGTQKEALDIMGCSGSGKVLKFAEIIGAATLAGELVTCAAIATGSFVKGHAMLGRNKPE
jgi:hydroxymethylglutaryl-CoA reductase (NADPH)